MNLAGKRVLVTGADGFIGSHLAEQLVALGCDVRSFAYYNSFGSWGWLDTVSSDVTDAMDVFMGDVRDPNGVRTALEGIDVVFHLAALIGIPYSYHSPDSYVDTNMKGTLNILQASRDLGLERVVVTSTSEVYGTARYAPIDEQHPLQGQSPYSATKIGADKIAESFYLSFGVPVVTARPFNTYGPRQSARAVIPTIITQLLDGAESISLGSTQPTRDFNYVADTCEGFVALAGCDDAVGRAVNIGTGREISIGEVAALVADAIAPGTPIVSDEQRVRPKNSEVERLIADNALIRALTGWEPRHTLEQGLEQTITWFRDPANRASYKSALYNV
ncbi:MAG: NAD-dependent 4,6-dehydratase LegB [Coriobacteriia bacterium]|nr:NAD-dependent 4,6-dehydratase LegB [Coriobacteriia bacterium]